MKLKSVLILAFLTLTLIPAVIVSSLLYKSGLSLSKESYTRNLIESINVQVDYISQTIENNMIFDYRFANRVYNRILDVGGTPDGGRSELLSAFQSYLEASEDKITVCLLLDKDNSFVYTIGENATIEAVEAQLPQLSMLSGQTISEFKLLDGTYSIGIITPIRSSDGTYGGSFVSIYDKSYIFKIISSYYKIADTSTYICRSNGGIVNSRGMADEGRNAAVEQTLGKIDFGTESTIAMNAGGLTLSGYYKNIHNTPWYLVGFIDDNLIQTFTNQFVWVYLLIIACVLIAGIVLSVYISQKVVEPINGLIRVMEGYQNSMDINELQFHEKNSYFETQYLKTRFLELMKKISLVQHNFEGIYQLYQSSDMGDTNIDIDTKNQTAHSNKEEFQTLMHRQQLPENACVVDRFINCFCEKDRVLLRDMLEGMRDEHLSIAREAELYTSHLGQRWFHTLVVPMYENDRLSRMFIQLRDISSFRRQEMESSEQVKRDHLTGLYNRTGFSGCVNTLLQDSVGDGMHGLLFIDMDYFKLVNDNFGHSAGDDLLRSVGSVLHEIIGPADIASRFGGDEFALFLANTSVEDIAAIKEELNKRLIYPFQTEKVSFVVSASIGVSVWSNSSGNTLEELLQKADSEMYHAKRTFKERNNKR